MLKFKFSKLVRDKIVDQQIASGAKPKYRTLSHDEHVEALAKKIVEEAQEITKSPAAELANEIADVQQAIDDLIDKLGITHAEIIEAQKRKVDKAGAFKKGLFIDYVEINEQDKWVEYYRENADRYPEVH